MTNCFNCRYSSSSFHFASTAEPNFPATGRRKNFSFMNPTFILNSNQKGELKMLNNFSESSKIHCKSVTLLKQLMYMVKISANYCLYEQQTLFEDIARYYMEVFMTDTTFFNSNNHGECTTKDKNDNCKNKKIEEESKISSPVLSFNNNFTNELSLSNMKYSSDLEYILKIYKPWIVSGTANSIKTLVNAKKTYKDIMFLVNAGIKLNSRLRYLLATCCVKLKIPRKQIIKLILGDKWVMTNKVNRERIKIKEDNKLEKSAKEGGSRSNISGNKNVIKYDNEAFHGQVSSLKEIAGGPAGLYLLGRYYERQARVEPKFRKSAILIYIKCLNACPFMWNALERLICLSLYDPLAVESSMGVNGVVGSENIVDYYFNKQNFTANFWSFYEEWGEEGFCDEECNKKDESTNENNNLLNINYNNYSDSCKESSDSLLECFYEAIDGKIGTMDELVDILRTIGNALFYLEKYECTKALDCLNTLDKAFLNNSGYLLEMIGRCYFEISKYKLASNYFTLCSKVDTYRATHLALHSTCLWHLGDKIGMFQIIENALKTEKNAPEIWCVLGNFFSLQNESEEAVEYFRKAILLCEEYPYAYTLCGHEYVTQEKFEEARLMYEKAIEIDPRHYNAYCGLAHIKVKKEDFQSAVEYYRLALEYKKNSVAIYVQQGKSFEKLGRKNEALRCYEQAVCCDPCDSTARFRMGYMLFELEKFRESLMCYQIAEKLAPLESDVHFALGVVYSQSRQTQLAWDHMHKALHYATDIKQRQKLRENMLQLWNDGQLDSKNTIWVRSVGVGICAEKSGNVGGRTGGTGYSFARSATDFLIYADEDDNSCDNNNNALTSNEQLSTPSHSVNRNNNNTSLISNSNINNIRDDGSYPSWTFVRYRMCEGGNNNTAELDEDLGFTDGNRSERNGQRGCYVMSGNNTSISPNMADIQMDDESEVISRSGI